MFTWGSKFFYAIGAGALVSAFVYGLVTGGGLGVVSLGYKGGVGDHTGYGILIFAGVAALMVGLVLQIVRDGDAEAMAERVGSEQPIGLRPPADPSYWGPVAAFGVACLIVGLAVSTVFYVLGIVILATVALMWLVLAWSDRATGDPEVNRLVRDRVVGPLEVPMLSLLGIAIVAVGVSRVFLAASVEGAVVAGTIVTILIFGTAVLMSKVDLGRTVVTGLLAFGALAVLAGGIIGAAVGERDFHHEEHHGDEHGEESDHSESDSEG